MSTFSHVWFLLKPVLWINLSFYQIITAFNGRIKMDLSKQQSLLYWHVDRNNLQANTPSCQSQFCPFTGKQGFQGTCYCSSSLYNFTFQTGFALATCSKFHPQVSQIKDQNPDRNIWFYTGRAHTDITRPTESSHGLLNTADLQVELSFLLHLPELLTPVLCCLFFWN